MLTYLLIIVKIPSTQLYIYYVRVFFMLYIICIVVLIAFDNCLFLDFLGTISYVNLIYN